MTGTAQDWRPRGRPLREEVGWRGMCDPAARFLGTDSLHGNDVWVGNGGEKMGPCVHEDNGRGAWAGTGGSRTASAGENVVGNGVHPHPNLPPSRGKGFVGALLQRDSTAGLCCARNDVWGEGLTALRKQRTRGG